MANDLLSGDSQVYDASSIEVLEPLEAVRLRPGMYIGGIDERAYHHLAAEIIDNSMDEAVAGHANRIEVELHADGALTVRDNGSGISELALAETHRPAPHNAARTSWGLAHVRQRLHTLYGERADMHINPMATGGGTCVVLTLPFETPLTA